MHTLRETILKPSDQHRASEADPSGAANDITQRNDAVAADPPPAVAPAAAAKGDDDLMSAPRTPVPLSVPAQAGFSNGLWRQQVSAAKLTWNKLSTAELLLSEGGESKLISLVQKHYARTPVQAQSEVQNFFKEQGS